MAFDYYPYGKVLREFGASVYLTTSHERDAESGLDYRGARFYDSEVARFLSLDPLAVKYAAWSAYNYVLGNPIMLIDPTGRASQKVPEKTEADRNDPHDLSDIIDEAFKESLKDQARQREDEKPKPKKRPPPAETSGNNGVLIMEGLKRFAYNYGVAPTYSLGLDYDFNLLGGSGWSADLNWLFVGKDASLFPYLTWTYRVNATTGANIGLCGHLGKGYLLTDSYGMMSYEYAKTLNSGDFFNTDSPTLGSGSGAYALNYDAGEVLNFNVGVAHSYLNNPKYDITNFHYLNTSTGIGLGGNLGLGPSVITGSVYTSGILYHLSPFTLYNNLKSWWYGK